MCAILSSCRFVVFCTSQVTLHPHRRPCVREYIDRAPGHVKSAQASRVKLLLGEYERARRVCNAVRRQTKSLSRWLWYARDRDFIVPDERFLNVYAKSCDRKWVHPRSCDSIWNTTIIQLKDTRGYFRGPTPPVPQQGLNSVLLPTYYKCKWLKKARNCQ